MTCRVRRLLFWAGLVALVACGGEEAASAGPGVADDIALSAWPASTLTVESVGAPPLAAVRVASGAAGGPETVSFETRFETHATRGVVSSDPMVVSQKRSFSIEPTGAAPTTFRFEVTAASDKGSGGAPVDEALVDSLRGRAGLWRADERCAVVEAGIALDGGPADRHLPGLLRSAVELCPLLPEEPMGTGARWSTVQKRADGSTETTRWLLTRRVGDRVILTFNTSTEGGAAETMAEGRLELVGSRALPVRYDARGRSSRVVEEPNPSGTSTSVTWTTEFTMHAEATPRSP